MTHTVRSTGRRFSGYLRFYPDHREWINEENPGLGTEATYILERPRGAICHKVSRIPLCHHNRARPSGRESVVHELPAAQFPHV